jgi:hypothetical protein
VLGASLGTVSKPDREVAFTLAPPQVDAVAELRERDYGTEVTLDIEGLEDGDTYWLWLTGADGDRVGAGTFTAKSDHFTCEMTAAIPFADTRRVWVTNTADETVLDVEFDAPAES